MATKLQQQAGGDSPVENTAHEEGDDAPDSKSKRPAKHDSGAADLEKVTDYHEEAEITNIGDAMKVVSDNAAQEAMEKQQRERELSKVKIRKEDVDLIVREMEISNAKAERILREHKGDIVPALIELTN
ncbi:huntingtin-interacting protein K-like [Tubulanus polymorphus]|uniref:huntingtin-interacting protein K-like n=1 Tax=Tubulanus polymorphus TaxID=672921 RepID=UPI003DA26B5E